MYKETKVNFRKDGTIKSKSIIESKAYGSLSSVREQHIEVEGMYIRSRRRRKEYSTRIIIVGQ